MFCASTFQIIRVKRYNFCRTTKKFTGINSKNTSTVSSTAVLLSLYTILRLACFSISWTFLVRTSSPFDWCRIEGVRTCFGRFLLSDAKGMSIVNEGRAETADWVARYQADSQGEPGYTTRTTNCCRYLEGVLGIGLPVFSPLLFFPWLFVSLCLQVVVVFLLFEFFSFFVPACTYISFGHLASGAREKVSSVYFFLLICLLCYYCFLLHHQVFPFVSLFHC